MDKEFLKGLGIADDAAEKIIAEHNKVIGKGFVPVTRFNEVNEELKNQKAAVKTLNTQLEQLKEINVDDLKAEITKLQNANKTQQQEYEKNIAEIRLTNALEKALSESGARNVKAARAMLDMSKIKLDGDTLSGLDEQVKMLKADDGTSFLFKNDVPQDGSNGVMRGFKPDRTQGGAPPEESKGARFAMRYNSRIGAITNKE